jgi:hypothetical protein
MQLISSNWSCILHEDQIVIHSEEADAAYQHFYPLEMLRAYSRPRWTASLPVHAQTPLQAEEPENEGGGENVSVSLKNMYRLPTICTRLTPSKSISKKFVFPGVSGSSGAVGGAPLATETQQGSTATVSVAVAVAVAPPGNDGVAEGQSGEDAEEEDGADAAEEAQAQAEDDTEPVIEEEVISEIEVPSTLPHVENEHVVDEGLEDGRDEESPSGIPTGVEDEEEDEDEEPGNNDNADEPSGSQGDDDVDEGRVEDELNAVSSSSSQADNNAGPATQNEDAQTPTPIISEPQQTTQSVGGPTIPETFTNPYPFPPWYPESAHFVRQWWPTLPGVPRLSCTVVLLAAHDPETHCTRFVLAQHYFKVPITPDVLPVVGEGGPSRPAQPNDDDMLHLWYVSTPFEVVCVLDEGDDEEEAGGRPRPLVAVDFGHAVWVEYAVPVDPPPSLDVHDKAGPGGDSHDHADDGHGHDAQHNDNAEPDTQLHAHFPHDNPHPHPRRRVPKCLRFVTFPPVYGRHGRTAEAVVRTLEIPEELDLDVAETINIDQSQGAVILSVRDGKIFILRYE